MNDTVTEAIPVRHPRDGALDVRLVHGIAWTGAMKWVSQLLSWACTIAVARLLTPADYGLVGMGVLYLELVTLVTELGFGAAIITKLGLSGNQIAQLNSLSVLLGAAGVLVSSAAAIPLSLFFNVPELRLVILVMSASCIISGLRAVPSALLERELQFKALAIMEAAQAIVSAISVLILALSGFGYWAIVLGRLIGKISWTAMTLSRRSHGFAWPRVRALRDPLVFSSHVLISRLSWYAQTNSDFFVVGRVFGRELLGAYTISFTMASMPTEKITAMVGRVAFPLFSAVQNDSAALRRYLLLLTRALALVTFPLACGLALVADEFVLGVLGEQWRAAIDPLRYLAFLILLQSIFPMLPHILNVTGESRYAMRIGVLGAIALPSAFYVGSHWGLQAVAAGWVTVYPLVTIPIYRKVFKKLDLSIATYLATLWPALSASLVMAAAVWALDRALPAHWPLLVGLILQIVVGGAVYGLVVVAVHPEQLHPFQSAMRIVRATAS